MKKALNAPVRMWQLVFVSLIVAILTSTVVVSAAPASSFLAQGTVRMALASGTEANSINVPAGYAPVAVLSQTISIPAGKVADLAVIGEVDIQTDNSVASYLYCFGRYRLDNISTGTVFKPGVYMLEAIFPDRPYALSLPINGYLQNVAAGSHTVYMVMSAGYSYCNARNRSMIILANIH